MRPSPQVLRTAFPAICVFLLAFGLSNYAGNPRTVFADEVWRPVALAARPLNIASNGQVFWVCGTDEMLARSSDGGQTWQVKHRVNNGEVLLRVGFVGENTVYAAGTNGRILWSRDSGETWTSLKAGTETILDISFGDDQHGIRHTRTAVEITRDGGANWVGIPKIENDEDLEKFKTVGGLAALNSDHMAIMLKEGPYGGQIFRTTRDGGKTWQTSDIPNSRLKQLTVHHAEYWTFGLEVVEKDKPGGGYAVPLALHSADGANWLHGVRSPKELHECADQGCVLWDGAIVDLYNDKPAFWAVPPNHSLTRVWALAKGTVCSVGANLKCVSATPVEAPPPRPETKQRIYQSVSPELPAQGCVVCSLEPVSVHEDLSWKGILKLELQIANNGTVEEVRLQPAPPKEIELAVTKRVKEWVFEPSHEQASAANTRETTLGISCDAFSDNQQGLCGLLPGPIGPQTTIGGIVGGYISPSAAPIAPQLRADILHLFEVMHLQEQAAKGGRAIFDSMRPMLLNSLPPTANREKIVDAYLNKLLALFKSDDFLEQQAVIYAKHFSDDDIKDFTKFYETPAGQHLNEASAQLTGEQSLIGQHMVADNVPRIFKELCNEFPELQGVAKFCPSSEDKRSLLLQPDSRPFQTASRPDSP